jgi:hypothetical protein
MVAEQDAMKLVRSMAEGRALGARRRLKQRSRFASSACELGCERHEAALRDRVRLV